MNSYEGDWIAALNPVSKCDRSDHNYDAKCKTHHRSIGRPHGNLYGGSENTRTRVRCRPEGQAVRSPNPTPLVPREFSTVPNSNAGKKAAPPNFPVAHPEQGVLLLFQAVIETDGKRQAPEKRPCKSRVGSGNLVLDVERRTRCAGITRRNGNKRRRPR